MLIDCDLQFSPDQTPHQAKLLEADGYAGVWAAEVGHDPFLTLASAALVTTEMKLGTGIVVAFGRSPLITATLANDIQSISKGRLLLGLGSQIKAHIENRYSMPWSRPAARMREYVLALRAIWSSWNEESDLAFRGEFYHHTVMTPFFSPGPNPYGPPKVFLAAVGELMTEVAGEVADGLLIHPFTTERYLREVTLPALDRGLNRSGRDRSAIEISISGMVATGATENEQKVARQSIRSQIAFYGSTPAYRGVLDLHGWVALQEQLRTLSLIGEWEKMSDLIDEEVVSNFAIVAPVDEVAKLIDQRFGIVVDRFNIYAPYALRTECRKEIVHRFAQGDVSYVDRACSM